MAAMVTTPKPSVYLAWSREKLTEDVSTKRRLSPSHVQTLRDVAQGVEESKVGLACRYLIDTIPSGEGIDPDGYIHHLEELERFCDRENVWAHPTVITWRNGIRRCRRTLARLRDKGDHQTPNVLMVAYGYPDPNAHELITFFGRELAPLVKYVDTVEVVRQKMIREEILTLGRPFEARRSVDLAISSGDALRSALVPFSEPGVAPREEEGKLALEARREERSARKQAHEERRNAFILAAKRDAFQMLVGAEQAYWSTWLKSAV